jgi:hypothetical protein
MPIKEWHDEAPSPDQKEGDEFSVQMLQVNPIQVRLIPRPFIPLSYQKVSLYVASIFRWRL